MNEYSTQNEMNTKAGRQPQVDLELQRQELILVELEVAAMALVTKVGKLYLEKTDRHNKSKQRQIGKNHQAAERISWRN